jgi:hypothetical protein
MVSVDTAKARSGVWVAPLNECQRAAHQDVVVSGIQASCGERVASGGFSPGMRRSP